MVLLSLVCCATAQFGFFQNRGPQRQRPRGRGPQRQNVRQGGGAVDDRHGNSAYHFSWRHDGGRDYTGQGAFSYCRGLGGGWAPVSINDGSEDRFVNSVIQGERQEYIWTGGSKRGSGWVWADGSGVQRINWSHTGGNRRPQPDNRDRNEDCLAVLNNFYGDGVKWHDVGCSHRKPTICEQKG